MPLAIYNNPLFKRKKMKFKRGSPLSTSHIKQSVAIRMNHYGIAFFKINKEY